MNEHKSSALAHYTAQIRRRIGRETRPAQRFTRHGQTRTDKSSGAQRREKLRWSGPYRFDAKTKVWHLQTGPGPMRALLSKIFGQATPPRTPRGRLSNPTALR